MFARASRRIFSPSTQHIVRVLPVLAPGTGFRIELLAAPWCHQLPVTSLQSPVSSLHKLMCVLPRLGASRLRGQRSKTRGQLEASPFPPPSAEPIEWIRGATTHSHGMDLACNPYRPSLFAKPQAGTKAHAIA
ncbi:unnamed protein product [Diplocarpon coronariae]